MNVVPLEENLKYTSDFFLKPMTATQREPVFFLAVKNHQDFQWTVWTPLNFWMTNSEKKYYEHDTEARSIKQKHVYATSSVDSESRNGVSKVNLFPHEDGTTLKECCLALFWGCSTSSGFFLKLFPPVLLYISHCYVKTYNSLKMF